MVIKSGKLLSKDFESNYENKPLYFALLKNTITHDDLFLISAYCTVQHVEKHLDSKYTQLVKRPNDEIKVFFLNEKFKCLKTEYLEKCSETPAPVPIPSANNGSVEIKKLKEEMKELKNIVFSMQEEKGYSDSWQI